MNEHLDKLQSRIRETGMRKVAAVIAAMPPQQRLLTRVCLTKNAGLLTDLLNWSKANPEATGALALSVPTALAAYLASDKENRLRNMLLAGTGAAAVGAGGGSVYRNWDKIQGASGEKNKPSTSGSSDAAGNQAQDAKKSETGGKN